MELIKNTSKDKLRGGFYTPASIVDFILKWAFNGNKEMDILEPSCGDGIFLSQIKKNNYSYQSILAIELDNDEAKKSRKHNLDNCVVKNKEFHLFCNRTDKKFDLIIGNPPFIRYQYFDKDQQQEAHDIFNRAKLKYSKLTNSWVSFIIGSSLLLKETGKIGFVVPAEILQVSFAKTLRQFLAEYYNKVCIVSFKKLVFPKIQQEVVLLLCECDNSGKHNIEHLEVNDSNSLLNVDMSKLKSPKKKLEFKSNKWTFYFLDQKEINFIEQIKNNRKYKSFGSLANVEVGITTGANPFFTVPKSVVQNYNLEKFAKPMVGRSIQANNAIFNEKDWFLNQNNEARANLLVFPEMNKLENENGAKEYIKKGVDWGFHKGYKCRIRDEWQIVPSVRFSDALFVRRNHLYPKLLLNEVGAYTTDTMHRVTINDEINKEAFIASYYNSLTLAFSEICGRSHGGGVLELMPNEVEEMILPYSPQHESLLLEIDKSLRAKENITKILLYTNRIILNESFGFSNSEIELADRIWIKLSSRRLNRNRKES